MKEIIIKVKCADCNRLMTVFVWGEPKKEYVCPDCTLSRRLRDDENYPYEDSTCSQTKIFCPWCGEWYDPDLSEGLIEGEQVCEECGKRFTVESEIEVTFNTQRVEVTKDA